MSFYADRDPAAIMEVDSAVLDRIKVGVAQRITRQVAETVELRTHLEYAIDAMVLALSVEVLGERLADREVELVMHEEARFYFPQMTWQMFKRNYQHTRWLGWFVRRWPMKVEKVTQTVQATRRVRNEQFALFPASPILTPEDLRGPVLVRCERTTVL